MFKYKMCNNVKLDRYLYYYVITYTFLIVRQLFQDIKIKRMLNKL